jgi:hypothetical protein
MILAFLAGVITGIISTLVIAELAVINEGNRRS